MKKPLLTIAIIVLIFGTFSPLNAHPLFPQEIIDFLVENPEADDFEFRDFLNESFGEDFARDFYGEEYETIFGSEASSDSGGEDDKKERGVENLKTILSTQDENKGFFQNAVDFTILGVEHILIGLDHVLFVISLILILMPWKKILALVTTFTVAHSITLILAGTSLLTLSGKIVEPIIALSIAYVAITTVFFRHIEFFRRIHSKLGVIFLFGLFHGLGFAGVFSDLQIPADKYLSSLLFFNVGVEIGQIIILLIAIPILVFLQKKTKYYNLVVKTAAVVISLLAIYWVVERIFF